MISPNQDCDICDGALWMCEEHEFEPWSHDECRGAGVPCICNQTAEMPPDFKVICSV